VRACWCFYLLIYILRGTFRRVEFWC